MSLGARPSQFQADPPADRRRPVVQFRGLDVDGSQQLHLPRPTRTHFDAGMEQRIRQLVGLASEDPFGADVDAEHTDFLRHEELDRLEREILANDLVAAQQVLVAEMRALVIQLRSKAEAVSSKRQRQAEDIVRIDQIVRWRTEIELREDAARSHRAESLRRGRGRRCETSRTYRRCRPRRSRCPSPLGSSSERNVPWR